MTEEGRRADNPISLHTKLSSSRRVQSHRGGELLSLPPVGLDSSRNARGRKRACGMVSSLARSGRKKRASLAARSPFVLAQRAGWDDELAVWFPSLLAEAARSECAPSMRAVEGNQTALTRDEWKERGLSRPSPRAKSASRRARGGRVIKSAQLNGDRAAAREEGILKKYKSERRRAA